MTKKWSKQEKIYLRILDNLLPYSTKVQLMKISEIVEVGYVERIIDY